MNSEFLLQSCKEYLQYMDSCKSQQKYLTYDFEFLEDKKWYVMGETLVSGNLRELTNLMNSWQKYLYQWKAWNLVLKDQGEMNSWDIRSEFVEPIVHHCLLLPSRVRDTFTSVATNALHQIRLSIDHSYKDHLDGEQTSPDQKTRYLTRRQKEKRLSKLAQYWPESASFIDALKKINNSKYIDETYDYRNLSSHFIAPNFELGETNLVTRSITQRKELSPKGDGTYEESLVPEKMSVSYGYGGTPPLNLEKTKERNFEQYNLARNCYVTYRNLLEDTVSQIEVNNT